MTKQIIVFILVFLSINNLFSQQIKMGNHRLYTEAGDLLILDVANNVLSLTNEIQLLYIEDKNIYFKSFILEKNPSNWQVSKKDFTISSVIENSEIVVVFFRMDKYFDDNRLGHSFTRRFYPINKKKGKYQYHLKLENEYENHSDYAGNFDSSYIFEETKKIVKGEITVIINNDGTITIDPDLFAFNINLNYSNRENYSGFALFPSCLHSYCFVNLSIINENKDSFMDIFYFARGDNPGVYFSGRYTVIEKEKIETIVISNKLDL